MTVRERWQAATNREDTDRMLFWPKLDRAYLYKYGKSYDFGSIEEFHEHIGSEILHGVPSCLVQKNTQCSVSEHQEGNDKRTDIVTPLGPLSFVYRFDEGSQAWHPIEFVIKTAKDVERMICYMNDTEAVVDHEAISAGLEKKERWGDRFFSWEPVGESPLMNFVEHLAGVENAHYLLVDNQQLVEEFFDTFHTLLKRKTELKAQHSVADMLAFIENTSTTLISPSQYRKYCSRHIQDYAEICRRHDRKLALHMCGHLRDILPDLSMVGAHVFEAFTSPTVGNTPLAMGREKCPETCLIGGTNAALWTRSADEIIEQLDKDLAELPHHRGLVLSSAGVMPPMCTPDTIKKVCSWIHDYSVRN